MNADMSAGLLGLAIGALLVFLGIQAFAIWQRKNAQKELREETFKVLIPLRIQAYERMVILLERMAPEQLIARLPEESLDGSAWFVQQWVVQTIREEFQHNVTQQLYLEESTWLKIKEAVDQQIWQLNQVHKSVNVEATGRIFLTQWISYRMEQPNFLEDALVMVRSDLKKQWMGQ